MGIAVKDIKILWGRAMNRCAICRDKLDAEASDASPSRVTLPAASDALKGLLAVSASSDSDRLRACLGRGTAFHNSNLIREERSIVEQAFRDGELRVLTSTTTLAAGINTPATTVIIVEHSFRGGLHFSDGITGSVRARATRGMLCR